MKYNEWSKIRLKDIIISANTGLDAIKRAPIVNEDTGYRCLRIQDISQKKIFTEWGFTKIEDKNFCKFQLCKDDILIARTGATVGVSMYISSDMHAVFNNGLIRLRNNREKSNSKFLSYLLISNNFIGYIDGIAHGTVAQPNIKIDHLLNYKFDLPSLKVQEKIASILSSIDNKIELNNKINDNLEQQALTIFKSWFVDFEPFSGVIPNDWKTGIMSEFYDISIGKTPPRKESYWFTTDTKDNVWVSISDMGKSGMYISNSSEYLTSEAISKFNVQIVPNNTVILSFKLTVGRVAISNGNITTNEAIAHFKSDEDISTEYLYCYLKNFNFQVLGSTSSIATAVNSKTIKNMSFVLPSKKILTDFHMINKILFEKIRNNLIEIEKLVEIRETLLPKLMNGEIDVSKVEV